MTRIDQLVKGTFVALLAVAALAASLALATGPPQDCAGSPRAPALDHVILAVGDLDRAASPFRANGFRLKPGRLHANNLLNRHIKFRDGTSIELMTVRGAPGDAMARDYANLLAQAEGGVYVALNVPGADAPARAAEEQGLGTIRSSSGPWSFVSFPPESPAAAVFFSAGTAPVRDPDSLLSHAPDVVGLAEVWLEGGNALGALLERLGARRCGRVAGPGGRVGERFGLSRGSLVVTPARGAARPRVLGAVLEVRNAEERLLWPHASFWLQYRPRRD